MTINIQNFSALFKDFPLYSQENIRDPLAVVKLFDVAGTATWYVTEFDPNTQVAFCYVTGLAFDEWGYVYLPELGELKTNLGIPRIERDIYFSPKPISQCVPSLKKKEA